MDYMLLVFHGTEGDTYYKLSDNDMQTIIKDADENETSFEDAAWSLYYSGYLEFNDTKVDIKGKFIRLELQLG